MNPQKISHLESAQHPQRLPGESAGAYHAFGWYCDQGPGRTLDLAWQSYCDHCDSLGQPEKAAPKRVTRCPGQWTKWSTLFQWIERAKAFDLEVADRRRAKRAEQTEALEEQRFQFERQSQADLQDRYDKIGATLDKYHAAPITDITQERDEIVEGKRIHTIARVKGVRGGDLSKVLREQRDCQRQAILGVRDKVPSAVETPKADHVFWRSNQRDDLEPKPTAPAAIPPEKPPEVAPQPAAAAEPTEPVYSVRLYPDEPPNLAASDYEDDPTAI